MRKKPTVLQSTTTTTTGNFKSEVLLAVYRKIRTANLSELK